VLVAQLRFALGRESKEKEELLRLKQDLMAGSAEARELWKESTVIEHLDSTVRRMRLPSSGNEAVKVRMHVLAPLRSPRLRVITLIRLD
jgi:hypothetical protein